jgi:ribosome-binding factor A
MASLRIKKINSLMQREIGLILQSGGVKDPRVNDKGFITITKVDTSADLRQAKVYVSVLGNLKEKKRIFAGLRHAKGFIQGDLSNKIRLKNFPMLVFLEDREMEHLDNIEGILKSIDEKHTTSQNNSDNCAE